MRRGVAEWRVSRGKYTRKESKLEEECLVGYCSTHAWSDILLEIEI